MNLPSTIIETKSTIITGSNSLVFKPDHNTLTRSKLIVTYPFFKRNASTYNFSFHFKEIEYQTDKGYIIFNRALYLKTMTVKNNEEDLNK